MHMHVHDKSSVSHTSPVPLAQKANIFGFANRSLKTYCYMRLHMY